MQLFEFDRFEFGWFAPRRVIASAFQRGMILVENAGHNRAVDVDEIRLGLEGVCQAFVARVDGEERDPLVDRTAK